MAAAFRRVLCLGKSYSNCPWLFVARLQSTVASAKFHLSEYKLFKLDAGPSLETECSREDALKYIEGLQRIRRMETSLGNMYKEKRIRGFCHLSSGQEAIAIGIEAALQPGDAITTAYRCHGYTITRGASVHSVLAELAGRATGVSAGKGGSMHLYFKDFFGGNGIVGAQVPLGTGVGLKMKLRGEKTVSVTLFGDGAANQGQVFEAFNIAKLWNLPVIFVCENNKYGMGTSACRAAANVEFYTRGDYIPGLWVDGMDVLTVREAFRFARDWCVSGKGPILLEAETYRYHGHSMSDPGTSYRTREEIQTIRRTKDPIHLFEHRLTESNLATPEELKAIEKKIRQEVDKDTEQCLADPEPALDERFTHLYHSNPPGVLVRGCDLGIWYNPSK
ncbi:unnamed protein product [Calicophoron daubneyi]|uniref:Pyruvate dehydrogenase E1 component subunit alpha n=1 Tax=Calicophoron daubneyi TaxID=300641 RepID=A0AAV2U056_CALDB